MTDKNSFLKGYLAGLDLRRGADADVALPSYDKTDFLAGLSVGLVSQGTMFGNFREIRTVASNTDKMLCEMYLRDLKGQQEVPKLPGMYRLQEWMTANGFNDMADYASFRESFGEDIAFYFLGRELYIRSLLDASLPQDYSFAAMKRPTTYGKWTDYPYGTYTSYGATTLVTCTLSGFTSAAYKTFSAKWSLGTNIGRHVEGAAYERLTVRLLPGRYKLWVGDISCTPQPVSGFDWYWKGIWYSWSYQVSEPVSVKSKSDGVVYNSANTAMFRYIPKDNWIEFEVTTEKSLSFYVSPFDKPMTASYGPDTVFEQNTSYEAVINWGLDILELYGVADNGNATLSEFLRAAEASGLYFWSIGSASGLLRPLVQTDQENGWVRHPSSDKYNAFGVLSPDIRFPAFNVDQRNTQASSGGLSSASIRVSADIDAEEGFFDPVYVDDQYPITRTEIYVRSSGSSSILYEYNYNPDSGKDYISNTMYVRRRAT